MHSIRRSVLVWYSARQMYDLVVDVAAYPQFLPWCARATVHEHSEQAMRATLDIDYLGLRQSFTTANQHDPGSRVAMRLERGPFSNLEGLWTFTPLRPDASKVELALDYRFASPLLERVVGPVFDTIANAMVDAFVQRAEAVHGGGG
jgi:ribosome-associated toxin RatA of RatAB toxin-antitoxin module